MDAILEKAEVHEDEEAPQSEANKELLGAFKCTNIALEEEEEEEEEREREREKEKEKAKKKAKQEELGWDAIIPEKHRASAPKPVRTIEGLEIYSDNEENLYVPIAARRKKRATKKKARQDGSDDGDEGRSMYKDDSDFKASGESDSEDSGADSGPERPTVFKHSLRCLKCNEGFALVFGLVNHMKEKHDEPEYNPEDENYINMPEVKSPKNFCFVCRVPGPSKRGYQVHINSRHGGVEPEQNYNLDKMKIYMAKRLGLPLPGMLRHKMRLTCLDCAKVFSVQAGLKSHMAKVHGKEAFIAEEEHYLDLPIVKSTMFRCFPCNRTLSSLNYRLHIHVKHTGPNGINEPPMNYDPVRMAFHEELTKPMICTVCSTRLTDPHTLRRHMLEDHQQADFQIQDSNYYNLPEVKSVLNRCIPCGRQFAQAVLYRLHVKNKHASKEPQENINDAARLAAIYQNAAMAGMPGMPSAQQLHNRVPLVQTPGVVLPPGISISAVSPAQAAQKKSLQCLVCHRAFMTQSALMSHMLVHQAGMGGVPGGMQMSQQAYLALPSVESTMNR